MNQPFLTEQKNLALKELEAISGSENQRKERISIVIQYLTSLLEPESFTEAQREDLRKLALELSFKEDTLFSDWIKLNIL